MSTEIAVQRLATLPDASPLFPLSQRAYRDLANNTIYGLTDPRNGDIRYVGFTVQSLNARRRQHMRLARSRVAAGERYPVVNWIVSLADQGMEPGIVALETFVEDWEARERFWIQLLRARGIPLLNVKSGGQAGNPKKRARSAVTVSDETRARISAAAKRRYADPEERRKASRRMQGVRRSDETRAKLRKTHCPAGHEYTAENTVVYQGRKECRTCRRERWHRYQAEKRAGVVKPRRLNPTHCPAEHEYTPENTAYDRGSTTKRCRTCRRERQAQARARKRQR